MELQKNPWRRLSPCPLSSTFAPSMDESHTLARERNQIWKVHTQSLREGCRGAVEGRHLALKSEGSCWDTATCMQVPRDCRSHGSVSCKPLLENAGSKDGVTGPRRAKEVGNPGKMGGGGGNLCLHPGLFLRDDFLKEAHVLEEEVLLLLHLLLEGLLELIRKEFGHRRKLPVALHKPAVRGREELAGLYFGLGVGKERGGGVARRRECVTGKATPHTSSKGQLRRERLRAGRMHPGRRHGTSSTERRQG